MRRSNVCPLLQQERCWFEEVLYVTSAQVDTNESTPFSRSHMFAPTARPPPVSRSLSLDAEDSGHPATCEYAAAVNFSQ